MAKDRDSTRTTSRLVLSPRAFTAEARRLAGLLDFVCTTVDAIHLEAVRELANRARALEAELENLPVEDPVALRKTLTELGTLRSAARKWLDVGPPPSTPR